MAQPMSKLQQVLQAPFSTPVYYFASTEAPLAQEAAANVVHTLEAAQECEVSAFDGPVPDMAGVIAAAGAISFFGTPRVVWLRQVSPSTLTDKDVDELAALFGEMENAVIVVSAVYKDGKIASGKKAKKLLTAAEKYGIAQVLAKPGRAENLRYLQEKAAALGSSYAPGAAEALLEHAGDNHALLTSETHKLAALCGYGPITTAAVQALGTTNIEADVFELARLVCNGRQATAHAKLQDLLELRHEPIAITAALTGTFIDMLRVRWGSENKRPIAAVFKDFGYFGSDYRLKKAKENAAHYSTKALEDCLLCLRDLDLALKSSALPDKSILLQAALSEIMQKGRR